MPAMLRPLTAAAISKAMSTIASGEAARVELRDGATPGLRLRAGRRGAKWDVVVGPKTSRLTFSLGDYPEVTLADARILARDKQKAAAAAGAGPTLADDTLQGLIDLYGKSRGSKQKAWAEAQRSMQRVYGPFMAIRPIKLEKLVIQRRIDTYPSGSVAAHSLRALRPILKWGYRRGYVAFNPGELEMPAYNRAPRDRVLSDEELRHVVNALGDGPYDNAIRLLMLTVCRKSEVTEAMWSEFDLDQARWTIPKERTKSGVAHTVPLPGAAVALLRSLPRGGPAVFWQDMSNWSRYQRGLLTRSGTAGWHRHDLRRTSATILGRLGVEPHVIEAVLAHKNIYSRLAATYNTYRYESEHRAALEALAQFYAGL